jgi:hypothetical protein
MTLVEIEVALKQQHIVARPRHEHARHPAHESL